MIRDMGSSPAVDPDFGTAALASEMAKGVVHPATEEDETGMRMKLSIAPGAECQEVEEDLPPVP